MFTYWENHTDLVIGQSWYPFFYGSTETPTAPYVGIWLMVPDTEQIVFWQDGVDVTLSGAVRCVWTTSSSAPAVAAIILQRSIERFVFGGSFRRVN